ncbi:MAG: cytochrome c biogenesis protein CcsA [Methanosarcinaceae archaeon]|nr:cytochrome c biogenesis protein CcsA [Methanosarcinaceae archaeon]
MIDGNIVLYLSMLTAAVALFGLLLKELRNDDVYMGIVPWASRATFVLLGFDLLLLTYHFITSDFTIMYVWQFTSLSLPLVYKFAAVLAGQSGTLLLWSLIIFMCSTWIAETKKWDNPFVRQVQIVTIITGMFFTVLTIMESPFATIYALDSTLPPGFIPQDGNGLNALLINPWMAIHPPTVFIAYGVATIPFAAALVYLLTGKREWEAFARQWTRLTWLFLTFTIALGGLWAYLVLGWGGFWAWDPVETSSLIPWITITAYMHAASQYRKDKNVFNIGAPVLAIITMILVVYAALVTRSGIFESVHAFGDSPSGMMFLIFIVAAVLVTIALVARKISHEKDKDNDNDNDSDSGDKNEDEDEDEISIYDYLSKKSIQFYITVVLLSILTFISFWGITFPAIIQLVKHMKVGVGVEFFNIWGYPAFIALMVMMGYCLQRGDYKFKKQSLIAVSAATVLLSFVSIGPEFHVMDHTSNFWTAQPFLYKLIGSISLLSMMPPIMYVIGAALDRMFVDFKAKPSGKVLARKTGINIIHIGMALILFGAVMSVSFTTSIGADVYLNQIGEVVFLDDGYAVKVDEYLPESGSGVYPGDKISDVKRNPSAYPSTQVSGKISEIQSIGSYTGFKLSDGNDYIWVATGGADIAVGDELTVSGSVMRDFESSSTGMVFDAIIFASDLSSISAGTDTSQKVYLEVFKDGKRIGKGVSEYVVYKQGDATHPMVDRSLTHDVYVIFQGASSYSIPLTILIKPFVNEVWIGVILFSVGIMLIAGSEMNLRRRREFE